MNITKYTQFTDFKKASTTNSIAHVGRKKNILNSYLVNGSQFVQEVEKLMFPSSQGKGIIRPELMGFFKAFPDTIQGEPKDIEQWKRFRRVYKAVPLVRTAIDLTTDDAVQFFHISSTTKDEDDDLKEEFVKEIKKLVRKFNLVDFFHRVTKDMLIFGNSFVEIVIEPSKGIVDLKILDPVTMFINRNKYGNFDENQPDAYLQFIEENPLEPIKFMPQEIIHFKHGLVGEGPYGVGLIEPIWRMLRMQEQTENDMAIILKRYAAPFIHVKVGDKDVNPFPQQKDLDSYSSDLTDIYADTEYVTPWNVDMEVKGAQKSTLDLEPFISYMEHQIIAGLQVPMVLLGRSSGSDRATAEIQMATHDRRIRVLQRNIKKTVEMQIFTIHLSAMFTFDPEVDEVPPLEWGEPEERVQADQIDTILKVKQAGLLTPQKANDLLPDEYKETLPENLKDPMKAQMDMQTKLGDEKIKQKDMAKEPTKPMDRIQKGKEKRNPKKVERKE